MAHFLNKRCDKDNMCWHGSTIRLIDMCHVLVIEDEPLIAMHLQDIFEDAGATSFAFAATEQAAVSLALEHAPAVIASDVCLLEGTGPQAVQRIHAAIGNVPVIFITATPIDCDVCNPPGIVLAKPISRPQVLAAFQQIAPI